MTRRVVITGMGGVTAFGESWQAVSAVLQAYENAVRTMPEWQIYDGLHTLLGAPSTISPCRSTIRASAFAPWAASR